MQMDLALTSLDDETTVYQDRPTLFIFGLPRSATTLTYQLISHRVDLRYVNNLFARFWLVPQVGIVFRKTVLGSSSFMDFDSDYGKSLGPFGPLEYDYFWHHWLRIVDTEDMLPFARPRPDIDWLGLGRTVQSMQATFGAAIVFKTLYVANHIANFPKTFSMPLFIYVERDPVDLALSIFATRIAYYGRIDSWWSTYPPDYHALENEPFAAQIAGQIHSLRNAYEGAKRCVSPELVVRLEYSRICEAPGNVVSTLRTLLSDIHRVNVAIRNAPPGRFEFHTRPDCLNADQHAVVGAMQARGS